MQIRVPGPEEYARYAPVMVQLTREHVAALPEIFYLPEDAPKKYWFDKAFSTPDQLMIFAEEDGGVLGVLKAEVQQVGEDPNTVLKKRRCLYILDMVVDAKARRQGVGKALFDYALAWGKERGAEDSTLTVYAFNAGAAAFYQSLGYKPLAMEMRKVL
jgi:GNAT superfamily N-acetyltransferase